MQDTNQQLLREMQNVPESSDDPKALRDRDHYLESVVTPLRAEHASLKNVSDMQTSAFERVELETNAYRTEAEKLKAEVGGWLVGVYACVCVCGCVEVCACVRGGVGEWPDNAHAQRLTGAVVAPPPYHHPCQGGIVAPC